MCGRQVQGCERAWRMQRLRGRAILNGGGGFVILHLPNVPGIIDVTSQQLLAFSVHLHPGYLWIGWRHVHELPVWHVRTERG